MRRIAASMLLLLGAAAPPPVPLYHTFGRWFTACDNVRACESRGFAEDAPVDLRVSRSAGAHDPTVVLTVADSLSIDPATIRLDGKPFPLLPPAWTLTPPSPGNTAYLTASDPAVVAAFISAVRNATTLQLGPGDDAPSVPLDGLTAALLLMDAAQGRPGTPTALIADRGTAAPPRALPVPLPPAWVRPRKLSPAEARSLLARSAHLPQTIDDGCDMKEAADVYALDAADALAIHPCQLYAYQSDSLVFVLSRHGAHAPRPVHLRLPAIQPPDGQWSGPDMTEPSFDPDTGRLSTMAKGRGVGDCGLFATWVWHRGAFHIVDMEYMGQCGGSSPGDFPALVRTVEPASPPSPKH